MNRVRPKVYVLAKTQLHKPEYLTLSSDEGEVSVPGLRDMLHQLDVLDWRTDATSDLDTLSEVAGRLCYMSFVPGMNPNVKTIREGNETYLGNVLSQKHGSVFEHANITFAFLNCSRVLTHELVRHRAGMGYSQQSMRYVRLTDLPMVMPDEIMVDPELAGQVLSICTSIEEFLQTVTDKFDLEHASFKVKKQITSAMRRMVPHGVGTHIIWTANMRALRHLLEARTNVGAEEEIRYAFNIVGQYAKTLVPNAFQDFTVNELGEWIPAYSKV